MKRAYSLGLLVLLAAGCARDPEDLCEDFVDECGDDRDSVEACVERADSLEERSRERGCLDHYYDYLDCVDALDSLCNTADECALPRDELARCGVFFE